MAALIEARHATGLSQRKLARKLSRSNNFICRVERGEHEISVLDLIDIANASGVSPADLICRVAR